MSIQKISDVGGFSRFIRDKSPYTVVCNKSYNTIESLEAQALWVHLLMLPAEWQIHKSQLKEKFKIGHNKLDSIFTHLIKIGLLEEKKIRDDKGRFVGTEWHVKMKISELPSKDMKSGDMETGDMDLGSYKVIDKQSENINKINNKCEVDEIFDFWKKQSGQEKAKLTDARKKIIVNCLKKQQRTVDEIKDAIVGCCSNEYNVKNHYTDLTLICRETKIDRYIALCKSPVLIKKEPERRKSSMARGLEMYEEEQRKLKQLQG